MTDLTQYNIRFALRLNRIFRKGINRRNRQRLTNQDFSLLCNNCNGGIITHDLGQQFRSPTVNLFFIEDHFIRFCENFEHYISQPLVICEDPQHKPGFDYPVCNLGDLELHFMHYASFEQAREKWESRTARICRDNLFVMWTFFGGTNEAWLERFDKLPFANKVAFTEKPFPQYKSAFYIPGFEEKGLGVLTLFNGWKGNRVIDAFDYVSWFNEGQRETD